MNDTLKKILSAAMVGCMVISSIPAGVLAEEEAAVEEVIVMAAEQSDEESKPEAEAAPVVQEVSEPEPAEEPAEEPANASTPAAAEEDVQVIEETQAPEEEPQEEEEADPTPEPTQEATAEPTPEPTEEATAEPTSEPDPTVDPTPDPSVEPSAEPSASPEVSPSVSPEASPEAALTITGFDLTVLPETVLVAYGTAEDALGLPAALTAVYSDGTSGEIGIHWSCTGDSLGGTAYVPSHEDKTVVFTFQAALAEEIACDAQLPAVKVAYAAEKPEEITRLVIAEKVDLSDVDLTLYSDILVEAGGVITGGETDLPVENKGEISGGVFDGEVINTKGALISGGEFNALVTNEEDGLIEGGFFYLMVLNEGVIDGGQFLGFIPEEPELEPGVTPEPTPTPAPDATPVPEEEEIIVEIENRGEILDGVFTHCKLTNFSEGEISGGSFADEVILPDGSTAKLDFDHTHILLKGGTLYFQTLEIEVEMDYSSKQLCIKPLNRVFQLESYAVKGADWEVSGAWAPAEDGSMFVPMDERFKAGAASVIVSYINIEDGEALQAAAEIEIPSYMAVLSAAIDYVGEGLNLNIGEVLADGWVLSVVKTLPAAEEGAEPTVSTAEIAWPENSDAAAFALKDLGLAPGEAAVKAQLQLKHALLGETGKLDMEIPARPAYSGKSSGLKGTYKTATELQLTCAEGLETALGLPDTDVSTLVPGSLYSNLMEQTTYYIWVRDQAVVDTSFASLWKVINQVTVSGYTKVSFTPNELSATWSPKLGNPAITFNHNSVDADDCVYTWTDKAGKTQTKAPTDVGSYNIEVSLKESKQKFYKLTGETKLSYTISPLEMTTKNTTVSCESITYNGKEQLPQKLVVRINGNKVDAGEFTLEKVSGQNYTSAGTKVIKIVGKGNVTGTISASYKIAASASGGGSSSGGSSSGGSSSGGSSSGGSSSGGSSSGSGNTFTYETSWEDDVYTNTDSGEDLHSNYLGSNPDDESMNQLAIVRDVLGEPMRYELLPVYQPLKENDTTTKADNTLLVIAQPDDWGDICTRILRMDLGQIRFLHQDKEMSSLLFRNGDAEVYLRNEELYTGKLAKLAAHMISVEGEEIDPAALDFDSMLDVELSDEQLEQVVLEVRIDPIMLPDESTAWEISLWLCRDDMQVEISRLMQGMVICLNVTGMFDDEDKATFTERFGISLVDPYAEGDEVKVLRKLNSIMLRFPSAAAKGVDDICEYYDVIYPSIDEFTEYEDRDEVMVADTAEEDETDHELVVDYTSAVEIEFYRNDILATVYAGEGAYLLTDLTQQNNGLNV